MQNAITLSMIGVVTTLGGVIGTALGRDAVAQIDPTFFEARSDPVPYDDFGEPIRASADRTPQPGWDYPYAWARSPVCWGCPVETDSFVDPLATPDMMIGNSVERRVVDYVADAPVQPAARPSSVDRYTGFPVTEDEARRMEHIARLREGRSFAAEQDAASEDVIVM